MTISKQRWHGLDHLRALAIVLVFLYHYRMFPHPRWVDTLANCGWTGVDLFFVLSGFLISHQLFEQLMVRRQIVLPAFYIKRSFRILPAYLVTLLLYYSIPDFREREALPALWKFLTFTQNLGLDAVNQGTFSHAWSLCIEEQFYLSLPLLLLSVWRAKSLKRIPLLLLILLLSGIFARVLIWRTTVLPYLDTEHLWRIWYMHIYYPTYTRLDGLIIGILAGYLVTFHENATCVVFLKWRWWFTGSLGILFFSFRLCNDQSDFMASTLGFTLVAAGYGILVLVAITPGSIFYRCSSFVTRQLAVLSYTIYLTHKGIIHLTQQWLQSLNTSLTSNSILLIAAFNCIIVAFLFRFLIEKPAYRLKNRILYQSYAKT